MLTRDHYRGIIHSCFILWTRSVWNKAAGQCDMVHSHLWSEMGTLTQRACSTLFWFEMYRCFLRRWYSEIQIRIQTRVFPFQNRSGQHLQEGPARWAVDTMARSWESEVEWLEEQPPGKGSLGITFLVRQRGAANTRCWTWEDWGGGSREMAWYREMRQELQRKKGRNLEWALCCWISMEISLWTHGFWERQTDRQRCHCVYHYFLTRASKQQWAPLELRLWFLSTVLHWKKLSWF